MATLLFKLTNVPDDEAAEVRMLLDENNIRYYETDAGFWRVGVDALWLADEAQQDIAKALLKEYQQRRTLMQREAYEERVAKGEAVSFAQQIARKPLRFLGLALTILFVLGLTLLPFMAFLSENVFDNFQ